MNTPSTTRLAHASALIVVPLSSSPPPVSHAYPVTCSKNSAAIQDLWTGSTQRSYFRLCRMSRGWFSYLSWSGDQWGSGISQRLIPLGRTVPFSSHISCVVPRLFWLDVTNDCCEDMRSSLLTFCCNFVDVFCGALCPYCYFDLCQSLDALLMMSEHCCYFCQRRSIIQGHCLINSTSLIIHRYFVDRK